MLTKKPEKNAKISFILRDYDCIPKHIAHKMAKASNFIEQKTLINFDKSQFKTTQTNSKNDNKKLEQLHHLALKNS